jgi:hypothetical protein
MESLFVGIPDAISMSMTLMAATVIYRSPERFPTLSHAVTDVFHRGRSPHPLISYRTTTTGVPTSTRL